MRIGLGQAQDELRLGHGSDLSRETRFHPRNVHPSLPNRPDEVNKPFSLKGFSGSIDAGFAGAKRKRAA
jgi:hypothetical protein